jgi:hypothetical protein
LKAKLDEIDTKVSQENFAQFVSRKSSKKEVEISSSSGESFRELEEDNNIILLTPQKPRIGGEQEFSVHYEEDRSMGEVDSEEEVKIQPVFVALPEKKLPLTDR